MKAADWIDRVKAARGWPTDYRAAKELGLSKNVISNYRSKPTTTMDDDTAIKVAGALGEEPELIIIDQMRERAKSDGARQALQRVLSKLGVKPPKGGRGAGGAAVSEAPAARVDITTPASTGRPGGASSKGPRNSWCPHAARNIHRIK